MKIQPFRVIGTSARRDVSCTPQEAQPGTATAQNRHCTEPASVHLIVCCIKVPKPHDLRHFLVRKNLPVRAIFINFVQFI